MTKDEALKFAVKALRPLIKRASPYGEDDWLDGKKAIEKCNAALAQPVQEQIEHCEAGSKRCPVCEKEAAQQVQEPTAKLLLQSRENFERNFGSNGWADWIYNDITELLNTPPAAQPVQPVQAPTTRVWMECSALAAAIHYPDCWDVAAYPELDDALNELAAWSKAAGCSSCTPPAAQPTQPAQGPVAL